MRFYKIAGRRLEIVGELLSTIWGMKRWWLVPMVALLVLFGVVLILAQSLAVWTFIYTLMSCE
jgi:hypothetical protein